MYESVGYEGHRPSPFSWRTSSRVRTPTTFVGHQTAQTRARQGYAEFRPVRRAVLGFTAGQVNEVVTTSVSADQIMQFVRACAAAGPLIVGDSREGIASGRVGALAVSIAMLGLTPLLHLRH
jgi:hypothetical protein